MVLGVVSWLLSRLLLPRLGGFASRGRTWWIAAVAFLGWWLPFTQAATAACGARPTARRGADLAELVEASRGKRPRKGDCCHHHR
jgi:hypothetical protein